MYNNNQYMNGRPSYYQPQYQTQSTYNYVPQQQYIQEQPPAIIYLNADQIKARVVLPGNKEILVDKENGMAYVVSTDFSGNTSSRRFSFKDLDVPAKEPEKPQVDLSEYVKKDDLSSFAQKSDLSVLKELQDKIEHLERQLRGKNNNQQGENR